MEKIHRRFHNVDKSPSTRPVFTHPEGIFGDIRIVFLNQQPARCLRMTQDSSQWF